MRRQKLTVDRQTAIQPVDTETWHKEIKDVFSRMSKGIQSEINKLPETSGVIKNVLSAIQWHNSIRPKSTIKNQNRQFSLISASAPKWDSSGKYPAWSYIRLIQELYVARNFNLAFRRYFNCYFDRDHYLSDTIDFVSEIKDEFKFNIYDDPGIAESVASEQILVSGLENDIAHELALAHTLSYEIKLDRISAINIATASYIIADFTAADDLNFNLDDPLDFIHTREYSNDPSQAYPLFFQCQYLSILQEAFMPDLSISFPMFNCFHLKGKIGDAMITGPGLVEFDLERDGTVHPIDLQGERPAEIAGYGYDLAFPMTAIPLGNLRRQCPKWRSDRRFRQLGVLPFLFPGNNNVWTMYSERLLDLLKVDRIFALMPHMEYWSKPFSDWADDDWNNCGLSALWDINSGYVLWAKGANKFDDMYKIGKPIEEFLKT